ncbi:hypothetical protein [Falsiroseomonas sp. E2-1-a4]|uniref:hypothetical protein n=1 Tax=Falsiroseomonas sp. E2-1-a4 TaxID=3239299 RepID=UPI003F3724C1
MRRAITLAPLPLFQWIAPDPPPPPPAARRDCGARLVLRDDLRDADGEPRACITIPGRRLPLAYPNLRAALAALQSMEAAHAGR